MAATYEIETLVSALTPEVRDWIKAEVRDFEPNKRRRIWLGETWVGLNAAGIGESRHRAAEEAYHRGSENLHRYFI